MKKTSLFTSVILSSFLLFSCVSKKKFKGLEADLQKKSDEFQQCDIANIKLKSSLDAKTEQVEDLKLQLADCKKLRDNQSTQVGDLTVLSQQANENINATLAQLEKKDKYIHLLQAAKSKADSINLALAINLKSVLKDGLDDEDVEINVDKTVVFINLSDKMLYKSGSYELTPKANDILGKIAKIIESRPDMEVMVESYTDNKPINTGCITDNWDLSVKRSTEVVRALQTKFKINPNRLIASGRGEYNTLAKNDSAQGRAVNRRTRIIILPKLNQFYDLLNPTNVPE